MSAKSVSITGSSRSGHCRQASPDESETEPHKVRWRSLIMTNETLLRSTSDFTVLRCFGRVFRDYPEDFDTFTLSDVTHKLHVFISYNWAMPQWLKFMALAFHFNHKAASAAATVAYITTILLVMLHAEAHEDADDLYFRSHLGTGICVVTYWLFLLCWHDVKALFWRRGKRVFLDRCCIHQTDEELKQQGIENLDIFLQLSDQMLVVYSELYTKKLWTMYELATFLPKRGPNRLAVLPTFLIRCTILAVPMVALHCIWVQMLLVDDVQDPVEDLLLDSRLAILLLDLPLLLVVTWAFRRWAKEEKQMRENVRTFHYGDSHCLKEADRSMVYSNIARYMRETKAVSAEAPDEDALVAFNELVRTEVPIAVTKSLGGWGIPLRYLFVILMPMMTNIVDYLAVAPLLYPQPLPMAMYATGLLIFATSSLVCATFLVWLTQCYLSLRGPLEWLVIFVFSLLHIGPFVAVYSLVQLLQGPAADGELWAVAGLVAIAVAQLAVLLAVHCRCCGRREEQKLIRSNKRTLYNIAYKVRFVRSLTRRATMSPKTMRIPEMPVQESEEENSDFDGVTRGESMDSKATQTITEAQM